MFQFVTVYDYKEPSDYPDARAMSTDDLIALWRAWDGVSLLHPVSAEAACHILSERGINALDID